MAGRTRPAGRGDARAIAAVHVAAWQQGYCGLLPQEYLDGLSVDDRERGWLQILDGEESVLVHETSGVVDAFVTSGPHRDDDLAAGAGEVYGLYVHPDSWRSGIGAGMLAAAVAELSGDPPGDSAEGEAADADRVLVLWTLEGNERARAFYKRQGWAHDGATRRGQRPAIGAAPAISFTEVRYRRLAP